MKVRLRSLENRETLGIEVPVPCSLQQFKLILSQRLPSSPNPDSIHLSLNRVDEIQSLFPDEETLQALGIASGDLIFYMVGLEGFSSGTLSTNSNSCSQPSISLQRMGFRISKNSQLEHIDKPESSGLRTKRGDSLDGMAIDAAGVDNNGKFTIAWRREFFSFIWFLRKVFADELGNSDDGRRAHKLLVIAVHAVLLDSGYVGFDMNLKTEITRSQFQGNWPCNLSLFYTLPGLIGNFIPISEYQNGVIMLKFQSMGPFLYVYGCLKGASAVHSVRLKEDELVYFLNITRSNCGLREEITRKDFSPTPPVEVFFNFWKIVKDKLALHLLIDLCERAGVELPPCFTKLPLDLKRKILESLPGDDIAKMSCMSSEFRNLSSDDDLWKQKYLEQFGPAPTSNGGGNWKNKFAERWKKSKQMGIPPCNRHVSPRYGRMSRRPILPLSFRGDRDILGMVPEFHPLVPSRTHVPRNLGGFYNRNRFTPD